MKSDFPQDESLPQKAITMGINTILSSKKILLLTAGKEKAQAIDKMTNGRISTWLPASFLQLHDNIAIFLDGKAASEL